VFTFDYGPISAGMFIFYQGTRHYIHPHYQLPDDLQYWMSFDPLVATRPFTWHGSTQGWRWCFECDAPAKVADWMVGSGVGRKLSLGTIEALILFAIRVTTSDGLQGEGLLGAQLKDFQTGGVRQTAQISPRKSGKNFIFLRSIPFAS